MCWGIKSACAGTSSTMQAWVTLSCPTYRMWRKHINTTRYRLQTLHRCHEWWSDEGGCKAVICTERESKQLGLSVQADLVCSVKVEGCFDTVDTFSCFHFLDGAGKKNDVNAGITQFDSTYVQTSNDIIIMTTCYHETLVSKSMWEAEAQHSTLPPSAGVEEKHRFASSTFILHTCAGATAEVRS